MRAAAAMALAIAALLVGTGSAAADVHTGEPFEDPACWSSPCEPGGSALTDLVDGSYDWSSTPADFQSPSLLDIQLATGVIPRPTTILPELQGIDIGTSPRLLSWELSSESGTSAFFQVLLSGFGDPTSADPSIGDLTWVYRSTGINDNWATSPGWYLYTPVGTTSISFSNCLLASPGSCRQADDGSWNMQKEEFFYEAMRDFGPGQLVPGPCSFAGNGVQTCQFARYLSAADVASRLTTGLATITQPLEPFGTQADICTGYADPVSGKGVTSDAWQCGQGPDPNPLRGPTLSSIDGKDDPTHARFNCLVRPSFCRPPPPPPPAHRPLIFLPGTLGSYLSIGGTEKWPNIDGLVAHWLDPLEHEPIPPGVPWDNFLDDLALDPQGVATNGCESQGRFRLGPLPGSCRCCSCVTRPNGWLVSMPLL